MAAPLLGEETMTPDKAKIAIIGTGWWSTYTHIPGLLNNPDAELVAVCDRSEAALAKTREAFGPLKTYKDLQDLLANEKLDGVIVSTNHSTHYELTKSCLEAGLHVLLEKPMVLRAAHAHALVDLAAQQERELIIGYPWHYTATTRQARDIIRSGELGAIQFVSCVFASMVIEFYRGNDQAYQTLFNYPVTGPGRAYADPQLSGGGQGHLQVTHSAGTLFYVTGLEAERVSCFMENWDVAVDLVDAISVRFKPVGGRPAVGVLGSTGNLGLGDGGQFDLGVYCEHGYLRLDQSQGALLVRRHTGPETRYGPLPADDRYPRFATSENLVDIILGRGENQSPATVGARVVELLEAAYQSSAQEGQPVRVSELG
jgi:predicted dehydrogenase